MKNLKNYLIGICGGGMLFIKACLSEDRVILNAIKEGEAATVSGTKASLKAETSAFSEIKKVKSSARLTKEKNFFNKQKIKDFLDFIPDPDYFKKTSVRILREVLDDDNKESLSTDFDEWYDGESYDWTRISNTIELDLNGKNLLDERFRHKILFQYSNTYFEGHCLKYMQSGKAVNLKVKKLKSIALNRGFASDSDLIKSIDNYLKKNI